MFGVSFANLKNLKKKNKVDQPLAEQLWQSGNHDARILATMVADPQQVSATQLTGWIQEPDNYVLTDALADFISQTPHAQVLMEREVDSPHEWISRTGWHLMARLALQDQQLPDAYFEKYLLQIEQQIHPRPNRARDAMNMALIAIGMRNEHLETKAIVAAQRIGKVKVDHGATNCKTPDAISYIQKSRQRLKKA
jgi:3-methyladenine DNA glycosylase AlkD